MNAKDFFNNQVSTDANKCFVDVDNHRYDREDLFRFAEAYAKSKQINLRDELIKYANTIFFNISDAEMLVDEYLNQKDK